MRLTHRLTALVLLLLASTALAVTVQEVSDQATAVQAAFARPLTRGKLGKPRAVYRVSHQALLLLRLSLSSAKPLENSGS